MSSSESSPRDRRSLKKWIVLLLAVSCLVTIILYSTHTPPNHQHLRSGAQVDSLIELSLARFNIPDSQIRKRSVEIDSARTRNVYTVNVPPGFSKTQWHFELDKLIRPYSASTPARIEFPDRSLRMHVRYGNNVIRTVYMRTDEDLVLYRDFATLILLLDRPPSETTINRIRAFGEPIQLAIRSAAPQNDFEEIRNFRRDYPHTLWYLQDNNNGRFDQVSEMEAYLNRLSLIEQVDSGSRVLFFNPYEDLSDSFRNRAEQLNLMLIDVSEAIRIEDLSDSREVSSVKRQLLEHSSFRWPPMVLVEGTSANIRRLDDFIIELKQDHVQLRSPYSMDF